MRSFGKALSSASTMAFRYSSGCRYFELCHSPQCPTKARLHNGDDVRIFDENGFELIDVLQDQLDRCIRVRQVCIGCRAGSGIVDKAYD